MCEKTHPASKAAASGTRRGEAPPSNVTAMEVAPSDGLNGLPDITSHPWRRRRDYLLLVAAVAASDEDLHPNELDLLNRWMDEFRLAPKSREAVLAVANHAPLDLQRVQHRLRQSDLAYSVVLDLMNMAMADGVLMDKEIQLLWNTAEALGIDGADFQVLIEFVHAAHQASQLSNPEPLFEHNIESAFALLAERGVQLFAHTLLCATSPDYDQRLKQRWVRFCRQHRGR